MKIKITRNQDLLWTRTARLVNGAGGCSTAELEGQLCDGGGGEGGGGDAERVRRSAMN